MLDSTPYIESLKEGKQICPTYRLYSDFYEYENLEFKLDDDLKNILDQLDSLAESILEEFNTPPYIFIMNPDCFEYIRSISDSLIRHEKISFNIQYNVESSNVVPYFLQIHMHSSHDGDEYEMESVLLRWNADSDRLELFDYNRDLWIGSSQVQQIYMAAIESSPESTFLYGLEEYGQKSLYMMDFDKICSMLDSNRRLIALAESMHEVGVLKLFIEYTIDNDKFKEENLRMILTPADKQRHGSCVYYDADGDGMFHICQMHLSHEDEGRIVTRNLNMRQKLRNHMFEDIAQTDNFEGLYRLLMSMWDHFNCGHSWLTIPISDRAFLNYRSDLEPDFNASIVFGDPELTGREKNEIEDLKEVMSVSSDL